MEISKRDTCYCARAGGCTWECGPPCSREDAARNGLRRVLIQPAGCGAHGEGGGGSHLRRTAPGRAKAAASVWSSLTRPHRSWPQEESSGAPAKAVKP